LVDLGLSFLALSLEFLLSSQRVDTKLDDMTLLFLQNEMEVS
jgi:hypothetical protein